MNLTHTIKAGYIYQSDVYTDERGRRFSVQPDPDADSPRSWCTKSKVAIVIIDADRHTRTNNLSDYTDNPAIALLINMLDENESDDPLSIDLDTWRKALVDHNIDYDVTIETCHGHSQSDWFTALAAVENGYGSAQGWISNYSMWAFGDVYQVIPEAADADSDALNDAEPLGGIYADSPEEAVQYYITYYVDDVINPNPSINESNESNKKEAMFS